MTPDNVPVPGWSGTAQACVGCGGLVPDVPGPVHPYMQASPGCWQIYGEVSVRLMAAVDGSSGQQHHVDAYAVQHPGGAAQERRQRQSVAVHLVSLCLLLEFGQHPIQVSRRRGRLSHLVLPRLGRRDWPFLPAPSDLGAVTAADAHAAGPAALPVRLQEWAGSAWAAWAVHHDTVRTWAAIAKAKV